MKLKLHSKQFDGYNHEMIDHRLVQTALEAVDTANFERFAQAFYGAVQDREFIPLGGVHDGGAEGYDAPDGSDPTVFSDETATNFLQVSKQATTRKKIRDTAKRLRDFGRNPKVLTYITSRVVSDIDIVERDLSKELGCKISIRDGKYIEVYINASSATQAAFFSYLQPSISHIFSPGVSDVGERVQYYANTTLAVFLRQEVDSRKSNSRLVESIADGLIIWALRDTDPDPSKGGLLNRKEILGRIEAALPSAKSLIRGSFDHRLSRLSAKDGPVGRLIRHYKKSDEYCLPYETRQAVAIENADDDIIKLQVSCVFEDRLAANTNEDIDDLRSTIIKVCHSTLERVFEHQGLKLAQFVENSEDDDELFTDVSSIATGIVDELSNSSEQKELVRRQSINILRGTFYKSSEVERVYLGKLSRTYVLMMLLKNDTKIIDYFSSISGNFYLYIGSDIIIRAISEFYLNEESQTTVNLLKIISQAGSKLILTEKVVEEVATHIRRQIFEFENVYMANEGSVSEEIVGYIDRLLIRAYFYAKLSPVEGVVPPKGWQNYISQFCNYSDVRNNKGDRELANYLLQKFGMEYESCEEMLKGIDDSELLALASDIEKVRERGGRAKANKEILAYNDALQVLRIYARRRSRGENSPGNPFGFQTWWLTQDQKIRRGAARVVEAHNNTLFMLRPEFLLNYIAMVPSTADVTKSFRTVFPSVLGVRLSSSVNPEVFDKVMRDAAEVSVYDDARAKAIIVSLTDKLKSDERKMFDVKW